MKRKFTFIQYIYKFFSLTSIISTQFTVNFMVQFTINFTLRFEHDDKEKI